MVGADTSEPAMSTVHMLNRSFIFDFLYLVGFYLGVLPRKGKGKTGFWLIGKLSDEVRGVCIGGQVERGPRRDFDELSRVAQSSRFRRVAFADLIVKGTEQGRSTMTRVLILNTSAKESAASAPSFECGRVDGC
jgi:hypothetical protein